jgi:hypothetical protein
MSLMLLELSESTYGKRSVAIGDGGLERVQKVEKQDHALNR